MHSICDISSTSCYHQLHCVVRTDALRQMSDYATSVHCPLEQINGHKQNVVIETSTMSFNSKSCRLGGKHRVTWGVYYSLLTIQNRPIYIDSANAQGITFHQQLIGGTTVKSKHQEVIKRRTILQLHLKKAE